MYISGAHGTVHKNDYHAAIISVLASEDTFKKKKKEISLLGIIKKLLINLNSNY